MAGLASADWIGIVPFSTKRSRTVRHHITAPGLALEVFVRPPEPL